MVICLGDGGVMFIGKFVGRDVSDVDWLWSIKWFLGNCFMVK